ncbi:hypothetical protein ACFQBY_17585 [Promicromonospora citrea]|uniref:Lipoprotein n=1 Tax=Promicromonospora citrea TaxID=43677 RepID=A0A8H9GLE2_9MICO|nr:hypothetical protein [Promicromonospora citrea]NNH52178.1 hypothetical protein [Promicromonospora citrea]GGM37303.1 hypothetical protein GCM10010102_35990 [Promicromonospora citrea]
MRNTTTLALATAGVLAIGLAGCSTGGEGDAAPAAETSAAASPAPVELTQASFVSDLTAAQNEARTVHLSMTHSGPAAEESGLTEEGLEADIDMTDPENPAMAMQMEMDGELADIVFAGGDLYMNLGEVTTGKYLSLAEAAESDNPMAEMFAGIGDMLDGTLQDMDPAAQLDGMEDAITSFEKTGTETVDGVETDVYTILVDPTKVTGPQVEDLPQDVLEQMGEMEVVYKIDGDNLPRAVEMTMNIEGKELVTSGSFTDWGQVTEIAAPSGDELITFDEMVASMG